MESLEIQKRKIKSYFGTRKYKLSFWGFNTHVDWYGLLVYFLIVFGVLMWLGYTRLENAKEILNTNEVEVVNQDQTRVDLDEIKALLETQYNSVVLTKQEQNDFIATSSANLLEEETVDDEEDDVKVAD
jgi:hypothetical protein